MYFYFFISLFFLSCFCCLEAVDLGYMFDSSDFQFVQWNWNGGFYALLLPLLESTIILGVGACPECIILLGSLGFRTPEKIGRNKGRGRKMLISCSFENFPSLPRSKLSSSLSRFFFSFSEFSRLHINHA